MKPNCAFVFLPFEVIRGLRRAGLRQDLTRPGHALPADGTRAGVEDPLDSRRAAREQAELYALLGVLGAVRLHARSIPSG